MLTAGWLAHKLNAPGKFLISAPEHDTPRRARAYLLTDEAVSAAASRHADLRPELDDVSLQALDDRPATDTTTDRPETAGRAPEAAAGDDNPDAMLWAVLSLAPEEGVPVADLVAATGMSQRWVHYRLRALAATGQAIQIKRGIWRTAKREGDAE
jgi:hypothetical protein